MIVCKVNTANDPGEVGALSSVTTPVTGSEVDVAGLRIHVDEAGTGEPLLILHHSTGPFWTPFYDNLDPEVSQAVEVATSLLRKLTASFSDVQLPQAVNGATIWGAEAYAYHSPWFNESPEKYQPSTRNSLQNSADAKAWQYAQARREVDLLRREIKKTFVNVDLLITPTMKTPPALLTAPGGGAAGGNNNAAFDVFGLPSITVPCGFTSTGLPIGLQITGGHWAESTVLALAYAYEQATEWHMRHPKLGDR